jgi:hypothetical protein
MPGSRSGSEQSSVRHETHPFGGSVLSGLVNGSATEAFR